MANPEQLKILLQGVEHWNKWRKEHPEVRPNLFEADLSGIDLRGADLSDANLRISKLIGANLAGPSLDDANLSGADLDRTDLREADLEGAIFVLATLSEVKLAGARLSRTNFTEAILTGTDFSAAKVLYAIFALVDLSVAKGLETVHHLGPSTIGIDTIYKSRGKIPEFFLRGCGVPENFIEYMRSLVVSPIEFYSCFISYSHEDKLFARRLHDTLQGHGIRCWLDEKQMLPGDDIYEQVDHGIRIGTRCCSAAPSTRWRAGGWTTKLMRPSKKSAC
jgi:TIR domain/Pentapeptide repeats (8 copies)